MTIGGWILFIVIAVLIICVVAVCHELVSGPVPLIIGFICIVLVLIFMLWWFNNTESGKRAFKSQESNFGDGIERIVKVYDVNGKLITEYDGKFDITYDDDRILFDDENGKRHIIYYPTGTVVIDEK